MKCIYCCKFSKGRLMINYSKECFGLVTCLKVLFIKTLQHNFYDQYKPCLIGGLRFSKNIAIGFAVLGFNVSVYAQANPDAQDAVLVFQPSIQSPLNSPQGACLVKFDIDTMGKTQNIKSNCSSEDFQTEAARVVENSIYSPRILNGQPVIKTNMLVTLKFGQDISDVSQEPSPSLTQQNIETVNASVNAIETERMSEQIDQMSEELDIMHCAKEAQKLAKSGGMFGGLGKIAKFAGYDDIAKGVNYYEQANGVIDTLSKKEKKLYEECILEKKMSRDNLKRQARIEADANRKYELALTAPHKSNQDAFPVVRVPPIFPPRFLQGDHSGFCKVRFDVNEKGVPFNIQTRFCTSRVLSENTLSAVRAWRYSPKYENGKTTIRSNVKSTIAFDLHDERGRKLPLPEGY